MHTRSWKRYRRFISISPDQIQAGDILHCYRHDDQWESRVAFVESVELDRTPGVWDIPYPDGSKTEHWAYEYRVVYVMRHINLARPDAAGGPAFHWHTYPWNSRYRFEKTLAELRAEYVMRRMNRGIGKR